ncbi:MAG: FecR domain-containing protein [Bacteriovoracaceae bacterium]
MKFYFLCFFITQTLFAQDFTFDKNKGQTIPNYVGELKVFKGKVFKISPDGSKLEVQAGTRFFKNEAVITEEKSFAKIIMVDDTVMSLAQNSKLDFSEFKFIDKSNRHIVYSLVKGQLTGHVKIKAKEGDIQVKTKAAVMGIRGTEILVNHITIDDKEISQFALLSGSAEVVDYNKGKYPLEKAKMVTLIQDTVKNKLDNRKGQLSDELFKELSAPELDEETEFKPFLPFTDLEQSQESNLHSALDNAHTENNHQLKENSPKAKGSFHNLQKLNEKLRKNQE